MGKLSGLTNQLACVFLYHGFGNASSETGCPFFCQTGQNHCQDSGKGFYPSKMDAILRRNILPKRGCSFSEKDEI
jgi:hypothetical protein